MAKFCIVMPKYGKVMPRYGKVMSRYGKVMPFYIKKQPYIVRYDPDMASHAQLSVRMDQICRPIPSKGWAKPRYADKCIVMTGQGKVMLRYGQKWPIYVYVCVCRAKKYSVKGRSSYWVRPRYVKKMMNINQDQYQEPCYTCINSFLLAARIAKKKGNAVPAVLKKDSVQQEGFENFHTSAYLGSFQATLKKGKKIYALIVLEKY